MTQQATLGMSAGSGRLFLKTTVSGKIHNEVAGTRFLFH